MKHTIWQIYPKESQLFTLVRHARLTLVNQFGQSMRKRRRRICKPERFTPRDSLKRVHEWRLDTLTTPPPIVQIFVTPNV